MAGPPKLSKGKTLDDMAGRKEPNPEHLPDPQLRRVAPMKDDDEVRVTEPGQGDGGEVDDPIVRVEVLGEGHFYNNHPLPLNSVIELPLSVVEKHREQGYQLGPVPDDYNGDIYDHTPEWQHPNNERSTE